MSREKQNKGITGEKGKNGPPGVCPSCGIYGKNISWDADTDVSTCTCGWSNGESREEQTELLINASKSNNSEVISNKQIEEMAEVIHNTWLPINQGNVTVGDRRISEEDASRVAHDLYNAGWRRQSEGEWETIPDYQPNKLISYHHICSVCKTFYKDIRPHGHKYCHECGAKMKGGAE